jgi:hypothetical protein
MLHWIERMVNAQVNPHIKMGTPTFCYVLINKFKKVTIYWGLSSFRDMYWNIGITWKQRSFVCKTCKDFTILNKIKEYHSIVTANKHSFNFQLSWWFLNIKCGSNTCTPKLYFKHCCLTRGGFHITIYALRLKFALCAHPFRTNLASCICAMRSSYSIFSQI